LAQPATKAEAGGGKPSGLTYPLTDDENERASNKSSRINHFNFDEKPLKDAPMTSPRNTHNVRSTKG
jgi:hypothetical protein